MRRLITHVNESVERGARWLRLSQHSTGQFATYWARSRRMTPAYGVDSPFITGMILLALQRFHSHDTRAIAARGTRYLTRVRRDDGLFTFLGDGTDPDVDDICLLNSIVQATEFRSSFDYQQLASRVAALPRGDSLYRTWIRGDLGQANDVDPCVNVNVFRFLHQNRLPCEHLIEALRRTLQTPPAATIYYVSPLATWWMVSTLPAAARVLLTAGIPHHLSDAIFSRTHPSSALDAGFQIGGLGLAQSRAVLPQLIIKLLEWQDQTGAWPIAPAFRGFNYWGSPELTTGVAVGALARSRAFVA
jgi:hypothetical protein